MAKSIIGKVAITPKGDYSNTTQYKKLDVVTFEGSSYVCIKDCQGIATTNTEYWQLMAKHGEFTEQQLEDFKDAVVEDSKDEMDTYTNTKKTELDTYVKDYEDDLKSSLDSYETEKEEELNGVTNDNISAINRNAENKITEFNTNATNKTNDFNNNATQKTTDFNTNATDKTTEYNTNATSKVNEYNTNANNKIAEYDAHVEELQEQIDELKETIDSELDTVEVEGTSIDVRDSAEYRGPVMPEANLEQKTLDGNQLFDINGTTTQQTLDKYNNGFRLNRETNRVIEFILPKPIPAGNYNLSVDVVNSTLSSNRNMHVLYKTSNSENIAESYFLENGAVTLTKECSKLYFFIAQSESNSTTITLDNIMLCAGNSAKPFESYCGGQASPNPEYPQEIKVVTGDNVIKHVGKNLLNLANTTKTNNGITVTTSNGVLTVNGTTSTNSYIRLDLGGVDYYFKRIPAGTYTLSANNNQVLGSNDFLRFVTLSDSEDTTPSIRVVLNSINANTTFTLTEDLTDVKLQIRIQHPRTLENLILKPQLELSTTATSYEQYREEEYELKLGNIELCKIGDYSDILFKNVEEDENYNAELEEGTWYKKNVVGKVVLDGSESGWSVANTGTANYYYRWTYKTRVITGRTLFNYYINAMITNNNVEQGAYLTNITSEASQLRIRYGTEDTLENYMSWLSTHNLILYHAFETPTYTQITDTTLISQLEALKKAKWFKGTNHWWTETENLEPNLKTAYKQSNNLRIQALEQAIVALGGV